MFQKARHNKIYQSIVDQVQEAIIQGRLKPGDKLPSENEMRDLFDVSRGTLREALRVLEQKGLIEIKTGANGGVYVKSLTIQEVSESLDLLLQYQKVTLKDLGEFREGVEGIVAGLAAKRADKGDIQRLKDLLKEAEKYLTAGPSEGSAFIQVDTRIHLALAAIAGNPVYKTVLQTIYDNILRYFDQFLPVDKETLEKNYQDLYNIVRAVERKDASKANRLVRDHVFRFNRLMEKKSRE